MLHIKNIFILIPIFSHKKAVSVSADTADIVVMQNVSNMLEYICAPYNHTLLFHLKLSIVFFEETPRCDFSTLTLLSFAIKVFEVVK